MYTLYTKNNSKPACWKPASIKKAKSRRIWFFYLVPSPVTTLPKNIMETAVAAKKTVEEFFVTEYASLLRYCRSRWNFSGGDVCHTAFEIARERYTHINFSLFVSLCHEAARDLELHRSIYTDDGVILLPPTERCAERLDGKNSLAKEEDREWISDDDGAKKIGRKLVRANKKGQPCLFFGGAR